MKPIDLEDEDLKRYRRLRELDKTMRTGETVQTRKERMQDFRHRRQLAGISRKELAALCKVSLCTVKNWETGKTVPAERHMDFITWVRLQAIRNPVDPRNRDWSPATLKAFRTANSLTQTELAIKLGVTRGTVARWEAGQVTPSEANIEALDALRNSLDTWEDDLL